MSGNILSKKGLVVAIILLFMGMSVIPSTATVKKSTMLTSFYDGDTLYVGGSGPGNYSKIQDAIDDASDGDTVFVFDDSSPYCENVVVDKSINLIGENRETTIIDGNRSIYVSVDWVTISEFTIQRGLHIFSCNNIIITGNHITDTFFSMGIWLAGTSNIVIRFNTIHNNRFGLVVVQCINSIIEKNNFIDNRIHATFSFIFNNFWDSNYWDRLTGNRPKIIFGSFGLIGIIPWINLDRNPAQEPYDI